MVISRLYYLLVPVGLDTRAVCRQLTIMESYQRAAIRKKVSQRIREMDNRRKQLEFECFCHLNGFDVV